MHKLLTILVLCASLLAIATFITVISFYQNYRAYRCPNDNKLDQDQMLETFQFEKLQALAAYPLLGQFYAERLIKEMVRRKQYEEVLVSSVIALDSIVNRRSYKIWFYKAVAECGMLQISSCRKSLYQAEALAPPSFYEQTANLLQVFNFRHQARLQAMKIELHSI